MKFVLGALAVILVGAGIMFWMVNNPSAPSPGKPADSVEPSEFEQPDFVSEQNGQFGVDRKDARAVPFDGKRAMSYLTKICDLGPRISGTKGMRQQQDIIKKHFEELGVRVEFQTFEAKQNSVAGKVPMTNIIVSFYPDRKRRVILCSHYDTRPIADQEPARRDWEKPFVSANDGGSGVAFLMEMGHHMKDLKTNVGVDFVFFDGEEFIFKTEGLKKDEYFIGSKHFARTWRDSKGRCDYAAAILLDMIAGKNMQFPLEGFSWDRAPKLCREVWTIAREQNVKAFVPRVKHHVQDDHLALLDVFIPAIDIIDFDYPHWHRLTDTPEQCSGDSMEQVAKVLSVWLQRTR